MYERPRCCQTGEVIEVTIRSGIADDFLTLARLAGYGEGQRHPSRFVRDPGLPGEEEFVLITFDHVRDGFAFRRFCREWEAPPEEAR
jgi:hypothetical protein